MPFSSSDRDNIRDIFGYSWSYNDCIMALLNSAYSTHGEEVVIVVQGYVTEIQTLQTSLDTASLEESGITSMTIEDELSITRSLSAVGSGLANRIADLKNKIRLAIDPYNQLQPQNATTLLRS